MDMKRILQAMDSASTTPVVGADSMARFLRVVDEANINQPAVVNQSPNFSGYQKTEYDDGSTQDDYSAGPLAVQQKKDAQGKMISNRSRVQLGADSIQQKQYASGVKKLTARGPGEAEYVGTDASAHRLGVDPAKVKAQLAQVSEHDINRFLSIVDKNNVSILIEGTNPHKVALPVQMAMQHYQQPEKILERKSSIIYKYFEQVEEEQLQEQANKQQLLNQYASQIAERVLGKRK